MAKTIDVTNKVVTIKTEEGGVYLTQTFDPREEGFTPFESNADAQAWAEAWVAADEAELVARAEEEAAKKAAFEADQAKLLEEATAEVPSDQLES
jgi:hypothetical protein